MEYYQYQGDETTNFRLDLVTSLFGQQIFQEIILKDDQNPSKVVTNHTCPHTIFIGNICTRCGEENNHGENPTLPFWYIYPNLNLSSQEINRIRGVNLQSLLTRKKLHLVLDLDHTLLHQRPSCKLTPEDRNFLKCHQRGVIDDSLIFLKKFKLSSGWVKLRPFVRNFLEEASTMFDMSIFTLGDRSASRTVAKLLDPNGKYFDNWRIISREDYSGVLDKHKKWLDIVLEHEKVVVVLDDRRDVWEDYMGNYVRAIPYNFFSYHSPEDIERDASPPRQSWSQLNKDESEENGVLAKVLGKLRMIYSAFYDDENSGDYESRDVREVIQRVEHMCKTSGRKKQHKQKIGRAVRR